MRLNNLGSNQTEIVNNKATILFSYNTPVAACVMGDWFRTEVFYSVTTSKHINKWLDGREAEKKPQEFFDNLV